MKTNYERRKVPATFHDLETIAYHHGVRAITWHRHGPKGAWIPHQHRISLRYGMSDTQTLCTFAHEVGHAVYAHPPCQPGTPYETKADEWAAKTLITQQDYEKAETLHLDHTWPLAQELGVTIDTLTTWRKLQTRKAS